MILSIYGHVGDGHIHFYLLGQEEMTKARIVAEISGPVHDLAMAMGGSFIAEYGLGQAKRGLMGRLRVALDPGKVVDGALWGRVNEALRICR